MVKPKPKQTATVTKCKAWQQINISLNPNFVRMGRGMEGAMAAPRSGQSQVWVLLCKPRDATPKPGTASQGTLSLHRSWWLWLKFTRCVTRWLAK